MGSRRFISLFTKTGDDGTSGLADGQRLPKTDQVFTVLGTLDELNSWLGKVAADLQQLAKSDVDVTDQYRFTLYVQDNLFRLGAELARSPKTRLPSSFVSKLEAHTEQLQRQLEPGWVSKFLLPGGSAAAANVDVTRAVCRRLERELVRYGQDQSVRPTITKAINRLSDYLFVLRVYLNVQLGVDEHVFHARGSYSNQQARRFQNNS